MATRKGRGRTDSVGIPGGGAFRAIKGIVEGLVNRWRDGPGPEETAAEIVLEGYATDRRLMTKTSWTSP